MSGRMLWDPFLYCINDSIQGKSETGNKVFVLTSKVSINILATVHQKANGNYEIEIKIRLIASKTLMNSVKFLRDRAEFE